MKKLALLATLLITVMFPSASYAEWTKVGNNVDGDTYYVDFERIRKVDGYVYYWTLSDYLKPVYNGSLSGRSYVQLDCKLFRSKELSYSFHKEPMAGDKAPMTTPKDPKWRYPPPKSGSEATKKIVCNHVK